MNNPDIFTALNTRLSNLITERVYAVFGTPEERVLMTTITEAGLEAGNELIMMVEDGLTYEKWKAFLVRINAIEGTMGKFENEKGEMAALVTDFKAADLRGAYEAFQKQGVFNVDNIQRDLNTMRQRLVQFNEVWAEIDAKDVKQAELSALVAEIEKEEAAEAAKQEDVK